MAKARDCGGHFIVTKPLAPIVVLERIIWIAREGRAFLLSDEYVGPDRRFGKKEPPLNHPRRRREDAEAEAAKGEDAAAEDAAGDADAATVDLPFIERPQKAAS